MKVLDMINKLDDKDRREAASILRRMGYLSRAESERFAVVELLGRTVVRGEVAEVEYAGRTWVEVRTKEGRKLYGPHAIYAMEFTEAFPESPYSRSVLGAVAGDINITGGNGSDGSPDGYECNVCEDERLICTGGGLDCKASQEGEAGISDIFGDGAPCPACERCSCVIVPSGGTITRMASNNPTYSTDIFNGDIRIEAGDSLFLQDGGLVVEKGEEMHHDLKPDSIMVTRRGNGVSAKEIDNETDRPTTF